MKLLSTSSILFSYRMLCCLMALAKVRAFVGVRTHVQARKTTCGATSSVQPMRRTSSVPSTMSTTEGQGEEQLSRGAWAGRVLGVALTGAATMSQVATPALAELGVGEGGLPDGAKQFSNLLKVQKDWIALSQTIKKKRADVSDEEWKNVALFLRKVYQVGNDLDFLSGQFSGDKKKVALDLVQKIQKEVQAADVPARERNVDAFIAALDSVEKKFDTFLELFQDVPSEL